MVTPPIPPSRPVPKTNPSQFLQRRERSNLISEAESEKRVKSLREERLVKINSFQRLKWQAQSQIIFRKLRFREPVDDRSPEPNNSQEAKSIEDATINTPVESIPDIDLDIPSDPIESQLKDISNVKSKVSVVPLVNKSFIHFLTDLLGGWHWRHRQSIAGVYRCEEKIQFGTAGAQSANDLNDGKCGFVLVTTDVKLAGLPQLNL